MSDKESEETFDHEFSFGQRFPHEAHDSIRRTKLVRYQRDRTIGVE